MSLTSGTRLGPYAILSELGAGAMGVVYRARDTRLGRDVAIKVLPGAFARDPDRLSRFEREARAVAAINHPNILSVHDVGTADLAGPEEGRIRATYMVTELLDGETLRTRLAQGPLPPRKAIDVAGQIARGLAAAHDRGIIHRDLKPENIVLLRDGHVKILDFGLAKHAGTTELQTMAATDAGTILGTVGYMAPEQVRGEAADARSDLFALGAVLYELASGQRAFARATAAETMTAILREDPPDLTVAPIKLSPGLAQVVRHALEKEPGERFQSARDLAFALRSLGDGSSSTVTTPPLPAVRTSKLARWREIAAWTIAAGMTIAVGALGAYVGLTAQPSTEGAPIVFAPVLPWRDGQLSSPAVAPDGRRVAYIDRQTEGDVIVVRTLDTYQSHAIKGTAGVRRGSLFWSPDGRSLGFFAGGKLKTADIAGGKIEDVADAPSGYGGTWGPDGTILFSPDERSPIFKVNSAGGQAAPVTTLDDAAVQAHRWPQFLGDGRHFIYMAWRPDVVRRAIRIASLDGGPSKTLFESDSAAFVAGRHFIFVRDVPSQLLAQSFNERTFELEGRPVSIVDDDNVDFHWFSGEARLSASARLLVYTTGKQATSTPTWFSPTGQLLYEVNGETQVYYDPAISADGTTMAVEAGDRERGTTDLWTVNLARRASSRLTSAPGFESSATWSPDGRRIAFASDQADGPTLRVRNATGDGADEVLQKQQRAYPTDWSHDGQYLLFTIDAGATGKDVWVYDFARKTSRPLIDSSFNEYGAVFSPDGKWVAYVAAEARDPQIYIRAFADAGMKIAVTTGGGRQPSWNRTGSQLFYLSADTTLMAATVNGRVVGEPKPLFRTNVDPSRVLRNQYVVTPDGTRIMLLSPTVHSAASPLVGVLHWTNGLQAR